MTRFKKGKSVFSIEDALRASENIVIQSPKTVNFDSSIILKIKNILTDFPDYKLSSTKLLNAIVLKWLEEHRDELIENHFQNSSKRY